MPLTPIIIMFIIQLNYLSLSLKKEILQIKNKDIVYKSKCSDCDCSYIGQTGQILEKRLGQHTLQCSNTDSNKFKSTLMDYTNINKHSFDFDVH